MIAQPIEALDVDTPTIEAIREEATNQLLPTDANLELIVDGLQEETLETIRDDIVRGIESVAGYNKSWSVEGSVAHYYIEDTGVWLDGIESALRDDPATNGWEQYPDALRDLASEILYAALQATGPTDHRRLTARYTGPVTHTA